MFDCANVEMRELLPELAAGTLDAVTRVRVDEHVLGCAECASELETLRLVRSAFRAAPTVDTRRIVAALPKPGAAVATAARSAERPVKRWVDWRIAAALTMITVGGLSVAVTQRRGSDSVTVPVDSGSAVTVVIPTNAGTNAAVDSTSVESGGTDSAGGSTTHPATALRPQLSFNGGVGDLDDASIQALLGALDEIDRAPLAPSAEPDRSSVLPVIKAGDR